MIRYALHCENDHDFEAWFRSAEDYERAAKRGENLCPHCGSAEVEKSLMAPSVSGTKKSAKVSLAAPDPRTQVMREALREFRKRVTEGADYVGDKFAEEARKIHYEETEARGIYGEATPDEAKELAEEGIGFHPLPVLPEDRN
jgi:hypothetical protein